MATGITAEKAELIKRYLETEKPTPTLVEAFQAHGLSSELIDSKTLLDFLGVELYAVVTKDVPMDTASL